MYIVLPPLKKENLPIYPTTLGLCREQRYISRPKGANFNHVLYVSEGEGVFVFNGMKRIISAGNAIFFKKGFPVDYGPKSLDFKTSWITFDGGGGEQLIEYFDAGDYEITSFPEVELKIAELYSLAEKNNVSALLSAKAYSLLVDFFLKLKERNKLPILEKAKYFIGQNYSKDLSVPEIASKLGISTSLLYKLFREQEKTTPIEYLQDVRIQKACNMLTTKKTGISEIGNLCGFSDTSYFCKVFKKTVGCTPLAYRKNMFDW